MRKPCCGGDDDPVPVVPPRSFAAVAVGLAISLSAALAGLAWGSSGFTIRVSNSGAGGDPGYFYVGGPINLTVAGRAPARTYEVCMTPSPIDRASCRHGRVGRTLELLGAPSKAGQTKLRLDFGQGHVYVKFIRVRAS